MRSGIFLAVLLQLQGCTTVFVESADGKIETEKGFGVFQLNTQPGQTAQIVRLKGFGITSQNGAVTLGYASSEFAILPPSDCRIVIWLEEDVDNLALMNDLASSEDQLCFVGPGANNLREKQQ